MQIHSKYPEIGTEVTRQTRLSLQSFLNKEPRKTTKGYVFYIQPVSSFWHGLHLYITISWTDGTLSAHDVNSFMSKYIN